MSHPFFSRNPTVHHYEEEQLPSFFSTRGYSNYSSPKVEKYRYQQQQDIDQPTVQFKVFALNKLQSETGARFGLNNASAIYRFELNANNKSFGALLRVLNSHNVSSQTHKLYYQDEEQDFVNLSNEADFRYMLKIMNKKGETIKIICEQDIQHELPVRRIPVSAIQQPRTRALPYSFFRLPLVVSSNEESKNSRDENLIENGFDSALPRVCKEGQLLRDRANRVSELLKKAEKEFPKQKDQKKEEQPQRKQRSFEDLVAELFEKKLAERKQQEEPTPVVSSAEVESNSAPEPTELVVEQVYAAEEQPSLSTSQIISSYLVADEDDDDEEQYIKLSEDVEEFEDSAQVQYPVFENEPEPSLPEPTQPQQPQVEYENELKLLSDMGFFDSSQNITLLKKYNGNIQRVVSELIYF